MAQDKDKEREKELPATAGGSPSPRKAAEPKSAEAHRNGDAHEKKASGPGRSAPRGATNRGSGVAGCTQRWQQYLIAVRSPAPVLAGFQTPPLQPQSIEAIVDYLNRQEGVETIARMKPAGDQPFAPNGAFAQEIVVARMAEDRAQSLRAAADPRIIVERDARLVAGGGGTAMRGRTGVSAILPLSPLVAQLELRIVDEREQPLPRAAVVVYGSGGFPVQAVTDDTGTARLSLFGGGTDSVKAIYVRPAANYWERLVVAPDLNEAGATTIGLRPLTDTLPNFPNDRAALWDRRLMRMGPPADSNLTGAGIRVAIIDSGCDNAHPALRQLTRGKDFTTRRGEDGWTGDVLGSGTHSAGLVAAAAAPGQGMTGCAPEAEVHVLKVLPGGRLSNLLAALDECIAREIDVVSVNVGCDEESELLAQKLRELRHKGIACIAAAGNGATQAPAAAFPTVLAVGAVGALRTFPPDTCHARAVMPESVGTQGVFPAAFSGVGPHIGVSAPGVAVLSTVPGGHAALDGIGAAAALVSGMAALILAHHPLFQGPMKARSEQRVVALFNLLRASAVPQFADALRGGAGVPDLQRVPGLYGLTAAGLRAPAVGTGVFDDGYGAGGVYGLSPAGIMPFLQAWPAMGPAWAGSAWGPARRTAGPI